MSKVDGSGVFRIGGDMPVHRMGFGAMRLVGPMAFGSRGEGFDASAVLHRALDLGIDLIDTADGYGPFRNEYQIAEALHPYRPGLVIATKGATIRTATREVVHVNSSPAWMREALESSLRRLRTDCIDLYQVHRLDGVTPIEDTVGELVRLRDEGKIRHIGLSEVDVDAIRRAETVAPIATVQNLYNAQDRRHEAVLDYCEQRGIGFIPWYPLGAGELMADDNPLVTIAARLGAKPSQVALAWLLARSPVMLLIPGTGSIPHLEENVAACDLALTAEDVAAIGNSAAGPLSYRVFRGADEG